MGKLALGYGSEFHLLRMMGRHRMFLNTKINELLENNEAISWYDFAFSNESEYNDLEFKGINFLDPEKHNSIIQEWNDLWPGGSSKTLNWDSIGKIGNEFLLVEAKAHIGEVKSSSQAAGDSKERIGELFSQLKSKYSISTQNDWTMTHYQKANRLLFLDFLISRGIPAKLLYIYFLNGYSSANAKEEKSVTNPETWIQSIDNEKDYLGIRNISFFDSNVYNLILDAKG